MYSFYTGYQWFVPSRVLWMSSSSNIQGPFDLTRLANLPFLCICLWDILIGRSLCDVDAVERNTQTPLRLQTTGAIDNEMGKS